MNGLPIRYASMAICISFLSVATATRAQERQPIHFSYPYAHIAQPAAATQDFLYVASNSFNGPNTNDVSVYPITASGFAKPLYTIKGPHTGVRTPSAIAVAATGMMYVPNFGGYHETATLAVVPTGKGDVTAKAIITCHITQSLGVALDARSNIHVSDTGTPGILTFRNNANGCAAPISQISGSKTELVTPTGVALDSYGRTMATQFSFSGSNSTSGSINVYGPDAVGNVTPSVRIVGSHTGLTEPLGLDVDNHANIYVTNEQNYPPGPPSVLEFAHNANGNASPIRWIGGSKTMLNLPRAIAVSKRTGEIYVADQVGVLVFAASARGNVAPIRIVRHSGNFQAVGVALRE